MIRTVAIENYRSLRHVVTDLDQLTVVTGANGSGKTSFYRALRLLADLAREGAISTLAQEGGMRSALHAGPRGEPGVAMRLGFSSDDLSYAIDLGLPQMGPFHLDPEIKVEVVWSGQVRSCAPPPCSPTDTALGSGPGETTARGGRPTGSWVTTSP